ncbi:MAG: hypothetical protein JSV88_31600 [Candidatus Aminicenantes bacterium]|nr:MAG: hypothetical protein JSV88_31600 [Candidatus Aminicenantes bacterium]
MAVLRKTLFLLLGLVVIFHPGKAGESLVVIDKSGSMRGFYETGSLKKIYNDIREELKKSWLSSNVRLFGFSIKGLVPYKRLEDIIPGSHTLIDKALKDGFALKPDVILIITDNIQDPDGISQTSDITKFYSLLKKEIVEWVFIFPLKMPFNGWVYNIGNWKKERAALLYAILLKNPNDSQSQRDKREEEFKKLASQIEKVVHSSRIRCKPLEKGVIMTLKKPGKQNIKINFTTAGVDVKFKSFTPKPRFSLKLILKSAYENISVIEGIIIGIKKLENKGLFKDINLEDSKVDVVPGYIKNLEPSKTADNYLVTIELDKLKLDKNLFSLMKMPFHEEGIISCQLKLQINIPKHKLQLPKEIIDKYGTSRRDDPERICGLNQLVPVLVETDDVVINQEKEFNIIIPYPGWAIFVLLGFFAAVILVAWLVYYVIKHPGKVFKLYVNGEETGEVKFYLFLWSQLYSFEHGVMGKAKIKGAAVLVQPAPGFNWLDETDRTPKRFERSDRVSFSLSSEEGESILVELTPQESKIDEEAEVPYEESGKIFDD